MVYSALEAALARQMDVVICDTAGRLQAQSSLMEELSKVARVEKKLISDAPHEVLLVLDATIGQNALSQAESFNQAADLTGLFSLNWTERERRRCGWCSKSFGDSCQACWIG